MIWKIEFDVKAKKELLRLDKQVQKRIIKLLEDRVLKKRNPRATGSALQNTLCGLWRYRVGDYRIICKIEDTNLIVLVITVGHRKDVYKLKA
ncbi:MAG TPA: type II toxin-antitoxin system RelE/ParE family toxin [Gammaproteobacteria bacterium]|nr:type II toxin-antitoxin system RelE/ParE family toxin [Gammaproteobacteria bacterium]